MEWYRAKCQKRKSAFIFFYLKHTSQNGEPVTSEQWKLHSKSQRSQSQYLPVVMLQYKINLSYLQEFTLSWCVGACYFSHPPGTHNELQVSCFGSPLLQCQVPSVLFYNEQNLTGIQIRYFPCSPCSLENNNMVPKQIGRQMAPEHSLGNVCPC